ncbi:MAG: hypothetical protein ACYTFY_09935 [Planctomycetota bacterium]|jgi:hypothetical protein
MKIDKSKVRISKLSDHTQEEKSDLPAEELVSHVWELTKEVYSFTGEFDAESRLQRDVVSFKRRTS